MVKIYLTFYAKIIEKFLVHLLDVSIALSEYNTITSTPFTILSTMIQRNKVIQES